MSEHVTPETVELVIQEVVSWCAEQIIQERRTAAPDPERLKALQEELAVCAADREALQDADEDEVAEIAARYAARVKTLQSE
ncbi:hypothetical protein [Streptomyces sp. NPDC003247]|uniref:hypothetical protein n=1 Tax=Streptomyces sp. NPDC003247 TaxID=3364677 RepID=UPI003678245D